MNFSNKNNKHKNNNKKVVKKNLRVTTTIIAMAFLSLTIMSCRDTKKVDSHYRMDSEMMDDGHHHDSSMNNDDMKESQEIMVSKVQNPESELVLADYMTLKNALVETDNKAASEAGKKLENTLKSFKLDSYPTEQQKKLQQIIASAIEHSGEIAHSGMKEQRAHFQMLNNAITEMVAITGTEHTLYQQYCPMYGDGGAWLSAEKNIRNPYFGSKMMTCGTVQKKIN